jgi:serine/threonine protein phosphatase PrpC
MEEIKDKKDIVWVLSQLLDMMRDFRAEMGGEAGQCYVAVSDAADRLWDLKKRQPGLESPEDLTTFLSSAVLYLKRKAALKGDADEIKCRRINSKFVKDCKAQLLVFSPMSLSHLYMANTHGSNTAGCSEEILRFITENVNRLPSWLESGAENFVASLWEAEHHEKIDLSDGADGLPSRKVSGERHTPSADDRQAHALTENSTEQSSPEAESPPQKADADGRRHGLKSSPNREKGVSLRKNPRLKDVGLNKPKEQRDKQDVPSLQPNRTLLPPQTAALPEPRADIKGRLSGNQGPAIAFRLNGYTATPWLTVCLGHMLTQMEMVDGNHDLDMTYSADIAAAGAFRISEVMSNSYFTTKGAQAGPGNETAPLAHPPVISVSGDGTAFSISGRWKPYDGDMSLLFLRDNDMEPFATLKKEYHIRHDPRLMRKDLPVVNDEGYPAADTDKEYAEIPDSDLFAVAASRRGRSHADTGKPRDDSFYMRCSCDSGWSALAVADGAGSARYSRVGSRLACKTSVDAFLAHAEGWHSEDKEQRLEEILKRLREAAKGKTSLSASDPCLSKLEEAGGFSSFIYDAARKAYNSIAEEAERKKKDPAHPAPDASLNDYHTTLLFAAFRKFSFGWFLVTFWIGDGGLALYNPNGTGGVNVLGTPDAGEYAGQTRFLTMSGEIMPDKIRARTFYSFPQDFEALLMATDGVTDPLFPSEDSIKSSEPWRLLWTEILPKGINDNPGCPELFDDSVDGEVISEKLLEWLNFRPDAERKVDHGDRTLLIVKKRWVFLGAGSQRKRQ